jgi:hypothetical protein
VGNFGIAFTGSFDDEDPLVAIGVLTLCEFSEHFSAPVSFWGVADYQKSWEAGLRRLLGGATVSCLATSVTDPADANFFDVWPLYRSGDDIYVQNRLLFLDQLPHAFDLSAPWESVGPRRATTEDGDKISEWQVSLDDIREFLDSGKLALPER